jgi:hypothetical protein
MKRGITILIIITTLPLCNFAQQNQFWIKGGPNLGAIDGSSSDDIYGLVNLHTGVYASHDFNQKIGIQLEALMNTLSTVVYEPIYISTELYLNPKHTTLSYLSLPLLLRYQISRKVTLNAGAQYSILFGKNKRLTDSDTDAFKNGNWSLVFGLQVGLGKRMQLYTRYNPGLSSTGHRTTGSYFNNRGKSSLVIQFGVGFRLFDKNKH